MLIRFGNYVYCPMAAQCAVNTHLFWQIIWRNYKSTFQINCSPDKIIRANWQTASVVQVNHKYTGRADWRFFIFEIFNHGTHGAHQTHGANKTPGPKRHTESRRPTGLIRPTDTQGPRGPPDPQDLTRPTIPSTIVLFICEASGNNDQGNTRRALWTESQNRI